MFYVVVFVEISKMFTMDVFVIDIEGFKVVIGVVVKIDIGVFMLLLLFF